MVPVLWVYYGWFCYQQSWELHVNTTDNNPTLEKKLLQQAMKQIALKYDLRPSQVKAMRDDIRFYSKLKERMND